MANVPYSGKTLVVFNAEWAASISEKEFVKHEKHHGLTDEQLKEAYKLCKAAVKGDESPAPETT